MSNSDQSPVACACGQPQASCVYPTCGYRPKRKSEASPSDKHAALIDALLNGNGGVGKCNCETCSARRQAAETIKTLERELADMTATRDRTAKLLHEAVEENTALGAVIAGRASVSAEVTRPKAGHCLLDVPQDAPGSPSPCAIVGYCLQVGYPHPASRSSEWQSFCPENMQPCDMGCTGGWCVTLHGSPETAAKMADRIDTVEGPVTPSSVAKVSQFSEHTNTAAPQEEHTESAGIPTTAGHHPADAAVPFQITAHPPSLTFATPEEMEEFIRRATVSHELPSAAEIAWLHRFMTCISFGPPDDEIERARRIVIALSDRSATQRGGDG